MNLTQNPKPWWKCIVFLYQISIKHPECSVAVSLGPHTSLPHMHQLIFMKIILYIRMWRVITGVNGNILLSLSKTPRQQFIAGVIYTGEQFIAGAKNNRRWTQSFEYLREFS
jgi:hypothetical protein